MFKKGQLAKTNSGQYVLVLHDENKYDLDNIISVWVLIRKGNRYAAKNGYALLSNLELIGNNFKFKGAK